MDRKKAVVAAATVAGSLLAASTAYALTSGIVDSGNDDGAGNLSPVVEMPTTAPPSSTSGPLDDAFDDQPDGQVTTPAAGDDDAIENDDAVESGHHEDESGEPFEYEGREDDD